MKFASTFITLSGLTAGVVAAPIAQAPVSFHAYGNVHAGENSHIVGGGGDPFDAALAAPFKAVGAAENMASNVLPFRKRQLPGLNVVGNIANTAMSAGTNAMNSAGRMTGGLLPIRKRDFALPGFGGSSKAENYGNSGYQAQGYHAENIGTNNQRVDPLHMAESVLPFAKRQAPAFAGSEGAGTGPDAWRGGSYPYPGPAESWKAVEDAANQLLAAAKQAGGASINIGGPQGGPGGVTVTAGAPPAKGH